MCADLFLINQMLNLHQSLIQPSMKTSALSFSAFHFVNHSVTKLNDTYHIAYLYDVVY